MKSSIKSLALILCHAAMNGVVWGQSVGDYRSRHGCAECTWNLPSTWEVFDSTHTWVIARQSPTATAGVITIQFGDTITVTAEVTADQVVVSGALRVMSEQSLTIADGLGTDLTVFGAVQVLVGGTLTNMGTTQVFGTLLVAGKLINPGETQIEGTFQFEGVEQEGQAGNPLIYGANGALIFNSPELYDVNNSDLINGGNIIWPVTNGPANVHVQGGIRMNVARLVSSLFQTAAGVLNASNLTFSGTVQIITGGSFDSPPIYTDRATLVYNAGDTYNVGAEWRSGTSVGSGVPMNVIINEGIKVNMPGSDRTCPGSLSIQYQGALELSTTNGADLHVGGNWFCNGTLMANGRSVLFDGASEQIVGGVTAFDDLVVNNSSGISISGAEVEDSVTVRGMLTFTAGNIRVGPNQGVLVLSGTVSGASPARHVVTYGNGHVARSMAGGDSFQFPIAPTETSYNPLTISLAPADSTDTFSVRVDATIDPGALSDSLCVLRTWDIREATGGDNHAALTFQWAGVEEGSDFNRNTSSTYFYNGSYVEVIRNTTASGTDPFLASTLAGFPCTEFFRFVVATSGGLGTAADVNWDPRFDILGMNNAVAALAVSGSEVYAGGSFKTAGGVRVNNVAKWNGSTWSEMGGGVSGTLENPGYVSAVAVSGSEVYVGGFFSMAGGVSANNIAKWDGGSWSALGDGVGSPDFGSVNAIALTGNNAYVGGFFATAGGVSAHNLAKWDGGSWSEVGGGVSGTVENSGYVAAIGVIGSEVYVGGQFSSAGGVSASNIAKWNGSSWSALGGGVSIPDFSSVTAIAVIGNEVYVGGYFSIAGGVSANNIAKWDGGNWSALGSGVNSTVTSIAAHASGVYAGGFFNAAGDVSANYVAKWDGITWSALGSGTNSGVSALAVIGNGLHAGGSFQTAGNKPSHYFGIWHDVLTYVDEEISGSPSDYVLSQNYPNPFNPSTTIRYTIPKAGFVTLKVYNALGEEIEMLVSEKQATGEHTVRWNPAGLPSGVYFYRLQAEEFAETRKLALVK